MKYLTGNIYRQINTVLAGAMFIINTNGQTVEAGKSYKLIVSAGKYSISDDHLLMTAAKINSKGLTWSYTNNDMYQRKSITVGFEAGDGNYYTNHVKETGFLIEYKKAYSIIKNRNSRWNNYTGYSIKTNSQFIRSGDQYSWVSMNALSFYNSLTYSRKRSAFSFDLSIPLTGFATRPEADNEYRGSLNDMLYNSLNNPVFTSIHNHKEVNVSFQYLNSVSNRLIFSLGISYLNREITAGESSFNEQGYLFQTGLSFLLRERK